MNNNEWYDLFGKKLEEGDAILVANKEKGHAKIYVGNILTIRDDSLSISYDKWRHGKKIPSKKYFAIFPFNNHTLENIVKFENYDK